MLLRLLHNHKLKLGMVSITTPTWVTKEFLISPQTKMVALSKKSEVCSLVLTHSVMNILCPWKDNSTIASFQFPLTESSKRKSHLQTTKLMWTQLMLRLKTKLSLKSSFVVLVVRTIRMALFSEQSA